MDNIHRCRFESCGWLILIKITNMGIRSCKRCGKELTKRQTIYCSRNCARPRKRGFFCKTCNIPLTRIWQNSFCSHSCAAKFNNLGVCKNGEPRIRQYSNCIICNKVLMGKQVKFCSPRCAGKSKIDRVKNKNIKLAQIASNRIGKL